MDESTLIFDKAYHCPVCDQDFKSKTIRTGKVYSRKIDYDLRQVFDQVDVVKYDVIACPECGYAALARYFDTPTVRQIRAVREKIRPAYKKKPPVEGPYSYRTARERFKLAMINVIAKEAKTSERAYLNLRTAWLVRGETERLDREAPDYEARREANQAEEKKYLTEALIGFVKARQSEDSPICGMDDQTLDYLIAALSVECGQYAQAVKLLSEVIASKNATSHMKQRARDLKDLAAERLKEQQA